MTRSWKVRMSLNIVQECLCAANSMFFFGAPKRERSGDKEIKCQQDQKHRRCWWR